MLNNWFHKNSNCVVGLELRSDSISIVVKEISNGSHSITTVASIPHQGDADAQEQLKQWVHHNKLQKTACNIVLSPADYQMLLVEPPDVSDSELRSAIRWRLKDLLNIPVEQAAIDVFALPVDGTRANKKMVYVVAAEKQRIQAIVNMVRVAGLNLESIDISELAIRNIASELVCDEGSERGIAVARIHQSSGSVYIYRQGNMYLSRTFSLAYGGGLLDDLPEAALALEVQRSIDYYERQMGQLPPSVVYICGDNVTDSKVGPTFKASLAIQVQVLDPSAIAQLAPGVDLDELKLCLGAFGGALRAKVAV